MHHECTRCVVVIPIDDTVDTCAGGSDCAVGSNVPTVHTAQTPFYKQTVLSDAVAR